MPIYDYLCSACGVVTEVIHGIDAPPPQYCPSCGKERTLRKSVVAATVVFKGSGWAKKDRSTSRAAKRGDETREKAAGAKDSSDASGPAASGGSSTGSAKAGTNAGSSSGPASSRSDGSGPAGSGATKDS